MQVLPQETSTNREEFIVSIGVKGQITMPKAIRSKLKVKPKDKVSIRLEQGKVTVEPVKTTLASIYQMAASLKQPLTEKEMSRIAWEEHAQEAARKGL